MADVPAPQGAPAPEQGGGANQLTDLIGNISQGITMLVDVVGSAGNQQAAQALDQLAQQFQQTMEQVLGQGQVGAGQGMASPEAGGAAGAVPASMARP